MILTSFRICWLVAFLLLVVASVNAFQVPTVLLPVSKALSPKTHNKYLTSAANNNKEHAGSSRHSLLLLRDENWVLRQQAASSEAMDDNTNNNVSKNNPSSRMRRRKVKIYNQRKTRATVILCGLWYTLSVAYNIFSKRVLNMAPELAWTAAWAQMACGLLYVLPIWASGVRAKPTEISKMDIIKRILPVAIIHSLVHVGGVISMGAGAVSFTYIVKATEPAVSALLAALILKSFLPIPVYLTLIPVITGVSLASVSELSFSWKAFNYAMMSNIASASRGIVSKNTMRNRIGKNLNAMNLYAVLTILATLILFPVAAIMESNVWMSSMKRMKDSGQLFSYIGQTLLAALSYYTYNEVSFMALDNISPVSHALASTLRRVFIISSSMLVFGNKMTPVGIFGSGMAIGGALLYSAAKHHYKEKQR